MKKHNKKIAFLLSVIICISFPMQCSANIIGTNVSESQTFLDNVQSMINKHGITSDGLFDSLNESTNRLIVKTKNNNPIPKLNSVSIEEGYMNLHVLQFDSSQDTQNAKEYLASQDYVEYVEEDVVFSMNEPFSYLGEPFFDIEPSFNDYGCVMVKSETAISKVSNEILPEIVVAVFDSGLDKNHPYFDYSRIIDSGYSLADSNINDKDGHGTHVAGIIYNNTPSNIKISPYKVVNDDDKGSMVLIALTVYVAVDNGVNVINMSLGRPKIIINSLFMNDAVSYAKKRNVPVIVSAGNKAENTSEFIPASVLDCITVSSVNSQGIPSDFSNYGYAVDIAAPGEKINSTLPYENVQKENYVKCNHHYYATISGTSMSAPFVSAAVAILLAANPDLTVSNIETILKHTAYAPDNWNYDYGAGIVDFEKMLTMTKKAKAPKITLTEDGAIISAEPNTKIYYTTNSDIPNESDSQLYTGEPISISGVSIIRAIAYKDGMLESDITSFSIKWTENHTIPYKGRYKLKMPSKIVKFTNSNEEVISFDGERITGNTIGEARLTLYLESGQTVTCNITVEFANWQIVHKIFYKLFGVILWCFEFNC